MKFPFNSRVCRLAIFFFCFSSFVAQAQEEKVISEANGDTTGKNEAPTTREIVDPKASRDVVISSTFKPHIRSASKIFFVPDLSSSIDSLSVGSYTYNVAVSPATVTHTMPSASIDDIGFIQQLDSPQSVYYVKFGLGTHSHIDGAAHIPIICKPQKVDLRLIGTIQRLAPDNAFYQKSYDANVGLFGRAYIHKKLEVSAQYMIDAASFQSAYFNKTESPSSVDIPRVYHEIRLGLNNEQSSLRNKIYISPQLGFSVFNNDFKGLNHKQSEFAFSIKAPASIILDRTLRLNAAASYSLHSFKNKIQDSATSAINNYIARGSAALQYVKDNLNAYIGMTVYGSNQHGLQVFPEAFFHLGFGKSSPFFVQALFTTKQYYQSAYDFGNINPWIKSDSAFGSVINMKAQGALQYNVKERLNLRLSVEWNLYRAIRLVGNDYQNEYRLFQTMPESSLSELVLSNDYMYILPNKYEFGLTITKTIASTQTQEKPYGRMYPLLKIYGIYHVLPRLKVRASVFLYDKIFYIDENRATKELDGAFNASLYMEYALLKNKRFRVWTDFANIFGQRYQRWAGYLHPGFIFTGGFSLYL